MTVFTVFTVFTPDLNEKKKKTKFFWETPYSVNFAFDTSCQSCITCNY